MIDERSQAVQAALVDSYYRYAEGLDTCNWGLVRSCFADRVRIDYGALSAATGSPEIARAADDWLLVLQGVITSFDRTRHTITNPRFSISAERVNCRVYLIADHVVFPNPGLPLVGAQDVVTVVGEYSNDYVLQGAEWKICFSRLDVHWTAGNLDLLQRVGRHPPAMG